MESTMITRTLWKTVLFSLLLATPSQAESVIRIGGNGTGLELLKALVPGFEKGHPGIKVQIMKSLGSSGGIKALNAGALDLALSSRPLKGEEKKQGAEEAFAARTHFIFMANRSVTKTDLSTREVEAMYAGTLATWPDGSQIKLVLRPEGDTDTKTMQSISPAMEGALNGAMHRPGMQTALTDEDSDGYIARIRGALGGSSLAQVVTGRLSCRVMSYNGTRPGLDTLASGAYPLVKEIIIAVNRSTTSAPAQAFVEFVRSPQGLKLLRKNGAIVVKQPGK